MERRVVTIMDRVGLASSDEARNEIQANDAAHSRVNSRFSDTDWRDPLNYDLVFNTARMPIGECVDQVVRIVRLPAFQETPESRGILNQLKDQYTVREQAREHPGPRRDDSGRPVLREERDFL